MKSFSTLALFFCIISVLFSSCGEDGLIDLISNPDKGTLTCKIDGVAYSSVFPLTVGNFSGEGADGFYSMGVGGLDFIGQDTVGVVVVISANDFSQLMESSTYTGAVNSSLEVAAGALTFSNRPMRDQEASSVETEIATITVTKLDRTEERISGTFSFEAVDPDTQQKFVVTEGVFTNVGY